MTKISGSVQVKVYEVLRRAVEEGITYGYTKAHKHVDEPDEDAIMDAIHEAVMSEICDYFDFDNLEP